jgi:hypothetical protein
MANMSKSERVPKPMEETFNAIVALTDAFCRAHLDEEYAQLAASSHCSLMPQTSIATRDREPQNLGMWDCLRPGIREFSLR